MSYVALKWVLPEVDPAKAIRLRSEYSGGFHKQATPDIFPSEIANSFA
jgi:hypothetical protein